MYKILIIEDSKTFNNTLKRNLKDLGEITQAFTFKDAKYYLENFEFDFIFLDLILPDGEGDDLIQEIPKNLRSKIIVLSGDNDIQKRAFLFELGILDYFSKLNPLNLIIHDIKHLINSLKENKNTNILVLDDSSFMRKQIKNILSPRQYNIFLTSNEKEAFEVLNTKQISLILLDIELKDTAGTEILEKIKSNPNFLNIPVLAISSNDAPHIIARLLKHGAGDFIKKPFIAEHLVLKCELHIKNYKNVQLLEQKTKELKEAQEAKSRFLANMSHEIRTPLNAILGFIKLLKEKELDEESKKYIEIIDNSSQTLLGILNDILDFSKIEANKLNLEMVEFNPQKEFQSVIELFKLKAIEKSITIHTNFENLPKYIKSDPLRIKQVLMNLLSNAIKFTQKNKNIYIDIKYQNEKLSIKIKDEGIGISQNKLPFIFKPFIQEDNSTTRQFGGTGLGLTISHKIIKLLGGELKVKSEKNKGSEFYFEIPAKEVKVEFNNQKSNLNLHKNAKILIVEDNKANQMFLSVILKKLNFEFKIANNGKEAVELVQKEEFDLILMDENMPIMNGIEATKKIREIEKKHIPIIAVTANALSGDRERFLKAGFDDYIPKPVDIPLLKEVINKYL